MSYMKCIYCGKNAMNITPGRESALLDYEPIRYTDMLFDDGTHPEPGSIPRCQHCGEPITLRSYLLIQGDYHADS